jgi:aminoglycoside phosphotransferase (APT) family kinase protein
VAEPPGVAGIVRRMAEVLTGIHGIRSGEQDLSFLPDQWERFGRRISERPGKLDESLSEGRVRAALARAWPPVRRNEAVLLHGDFWPGNTLWRDGELVGVIDWEDAAVGDPIADLANGRLEISMFLGEGAMREFTQHYQCLMGSLDYASLPCWDLCAALRPAGKLSSWGL